MVDFLWKNLEDQELRKKMRQNPKNYLANEGQAALQGLIFNGLGSLVKIAQDLSQARLFITLSNHEIRASLLLPPEQSLEPWLNSPSFIQFSELVVLKNLSRYFTIEVQNQQQLLVQTYQDGLLKDREQRLLEEDIKQISLNFIPDFKGFNAEPLAYGLYYNYCHQLAFLNDGLTIELQENQQQKNYFTFQQGLISFLDEHDEYASRGRKVFYLDKQVQHVRIKAAISRNDQAHVAASFANFLQTHQGGTHLEGLIDGGVLALNQYLAKQKNVAVFNREKFLTRFDVVISVALPNAKYFGITKLKLRNPEVYQLVKELIEGEFASFLDRYPLWYKEK